MNNGYSGTGISIIFYLILALLMPFVHFVRVSTKHNLYRHRFVLRHFFYGIMIIFMVVIIISWLISITGIKSQSEWQAMVIFSAISTIGLLVLWTVLPLIIKLILWIFRIHPSHAMMPLTHNSEITEVEHTEYKVIDGVMSQRRWLAFRAKHYGCSAKHTTIKQQSTVW